jgi:glycosyltransferase involved in cell wall biosynthesis
MLGHFLGRVVFGSACCVEAARKSIRERTARRFPCQLLNPGCYVLILSRGWAPTARAAELAKHWASTGHAPTVLTGFPNHPTGRVPPEWRSRFHRLRYRETLHAVQVERTWLWPLPNRKAIERVLNYSSFCISAALAGMRLPKPDVVIGTSPQLLVGLSAWWIARIKRVPFVFEVRDLWPESLVAVGIVTRTAVASSARPYCGFYTAGPIVLSFAPAFKDHLVRIFIAPEKISVVENGVETDCFNRPLILLRSQGTQRRTEVSCVLRWHDGMGTRS